MTEAALDIGAVLALPARDARRVIEMPRLREVTRHALTYIMLGSVIPTALFYAFFAERGLHPALLIALAWSLGLIYHRLRTAKRVEVTLMLGVAAMLVRTIATWVTGSTLIYLIQPLIGTTITSLALLVSVAMRRPLAERVVRDYVPLPPALSDHPRLTACFCWISATWGVAYLSNAVATTWMLTNSSFGECMVLGKAIGLSLSATALLVSIGLFTHTLRREQIRLRFSAKARRERR